MKHFIITLSMILLLPITASAGELDSPAAPDDAGSAMYTLEDIYQKLVNGVIPSKRGAGFQEPASGPGPTGHTLNDIMIRTPPRMDANGATTDQVLEGRQKGVKSAFDFCELV